MFGLLVVLASPLLIGWHMQARLGIAVFLLMLVSFTRHDRKGLVQTALLVSYCGLLWYVIDEYYLLEELPSMEPTHLTVAAAGLLLFRLMPKAFTYAFITSPMLALGYAFGWQMATAIAFLLLLSVIKRGGNAVCFLAGISVLNAVSVGVVLADPKAELGQLEVCGLSVGFALFLAGFTL